MLLLLIANVFRSKHITWTVEWFHLDGSRELHQCSEHDSLLQLYSCLPSQKEQAKKRKRDDPYLEDKRPKNARKKHKRLSAATPLQRPLPGEFLSTDAAELLDIKKEPVETLLNERGLSPQQAAVKTEPAENHLEEKHSTPSTESVKGGPVKTPVEPTPEQTNFSVTSSKDQDASKAEPLETFLVPARPAKPLEETPYLYLVRPFTSGQLRTLVPLSSTTTLSQCLRGRTVSEFPTIQALSQPLEELPEGFKLESDYLKRETETKKRETGNGLVERSTSRGDGELGFKQDACIGNGSVQLDEKNIMKSLHRDMMRLPSYGLY